MLNLVETNWNKHTQTRLVFFIISHRSSPPLLLTKHAPHQIKTAGNLGGIFCFDMKRYYPIIFPSNKERSYLITVLACCLQYVLGFLGLHFQARSDPYRSLCPGVCMFVRMYFVNNSPLAPQSSCSGLAPYAGTFYLKALTRI